MRTAFVKIFQRIIINNRKYNKALINVIIK